VPRHRRPDSVHGARAQPCGRTSKPDDDNLKSKSATSTATIALDPGTFTWDCQKSTPSRRPPRVRTIDWSLIFTNTGTATLDNPWSRQLRSRCLAGGRPLALRPDDRGGAASPPRPADCLSDNLRASLLQRRAHHHVSAGRRAAPGPGIKYRSDGAGCRSRQVCIRPTAMSPHHDPSPRRALSGCYQRVGHGEGCESPDHGLPTSNASSPCGVRDHRSRASRAMWMRWARRERSGERQQPATPCVGRQPGYYRNPCAPKHPCRRTGSLDTAVHTTAANCPPSPPPRRLAAALWETSTHSPPVILRGTTYRRSSPLSSHDHDAPLSGASTPGIHYSREPLPELTPTRTCSAGTWAPRAVVDPCDVPNVTASRHLLVRSHRVEQPSTLRDSARSATRTVNPPSTRRSAGRARSGTGERRAAWTVSAFSRAFVAGYSARKVSRCARGVHCDPTEPIIKAITGTAAAYRRSFSATASCNGPPAGRSVIPRRVRSRSPRRTDPGCVARYWIPVGSVCPQSWSTHRLPLITYSPLMRVPAGGRSPSRRRRLPRHGAAAHHATITTPTDDEPHITNRVLRPPPGRFGRSLPSPARWRRVA